MPGLEVPKISITRVSVSLDPPLDVWNVALENESGVWTESFGSEAELRAFLMGVKAAAGTLGVYIPEPETPPHASKEFKEATYEPDNLPI